MTVLNKLDGGVKKALDVMIGNAYKARLHGVWCRGRMCYRLVNRINLMILRLSWGLLLLGSVRDYLAVLGGRKELSLALRQEMRFFDWQW